MVDEKKAVDPKAPGSSDLPYHTKETEDIAKGHAEEQKNAKPKPYEFKANGYTVKEEVDAPENAQSDNGKLYEVTADGFSKTFTSKRGAEAYAETHAPFVKA